MINGISKTKTILYLAAIFVAGLAAGGVAGYSVGRHSYFGPPPPGDLSAYILARLKSELALSDEQVRQIEPLVKQSSEQLQCIHTNAMWRVLETVQESNRRLGSFLTAEQRQKLADSERRFEDSLHPPEECRPRPR